MCTENTTDSNIEPDTNIFFNCLQVFCLALFSKSSIYQSKRKNVIHNQMNYIKRALC